VFQIPSLLAAMTLKVYPPGGNRKEGGASCAGIAPVVIQPFHSVFEAQISGVGEAQAVY
jgi:hypothetical protein